MNYDRRHHKCAGILERMVLNVQRQSNHFAWGQGAARFGGGVLLATERSAIHLGRQRHVAVTLFDTHSCRRAGGTTTTMIGDAL